MKPLRIKVVAALVAWFRPAWLPYSICEQKRAFRSGVRPAAASDPRPSPVPLNSNRGPPHPLPVRSDRPTEYLEHRSGVFDSTAP